MVRDALKVLGGVDFERQRDHFGRGLRAGVEGPEHRGDRLAGEALERMRD